MFWGHRVIGVACVLALAACAPAGTASTTSPSPSPSPSPSSSSADPGRKTPEAAGPPGVKPRKGEVRPIPAPAASRR
ncbi:hypothetical protein ACFQQB_05125 [Nonomuraea rubra]|uniref:hypothetical protein n=1 Tax=Nonomuraea rubra TaxID=46180 RepID=UPI00361F9A2A